MVTCHGQMNANTENCSECGHVAVVKQWWNWIKCSPYAMHYLAAHYTQCRYLSSSKTKQCCVTSWKTWIPSSTTVRASQLYRLSYIQNTLTVRSVCRLVKWSVWCSAEHWDMTGSDRGQIYCITVRFTICTLHHIQGDSGGICITLRNDSMCDSKQKSSYEHGSDFERLRSYGHFLISVHALMWTALTEPAGGLWLTACIASINFASWLAP